MGIEQRYRETEDLVEALKEQAIVRNDAAVAAAFAEQGELLGFEPGKLLVEQGGSDRDVYFLLAGEARVIINGVRMHTRGPGVTIGEMSALSSAIPRSATLEAEKDTAAWRISHKRLAEVADQHPQVWRRLAMDLAGRIEQRNQYVNRTNAKPKIFLICSAEALDIAKAIRVGLRYDSPEITIWSDQEIFETGSYPLEGLEEQVRQSDFAIALAEPDDIVRSRDRRSKTVRDNVIFELGFFMSRLGRHRTLLLVPEGDEVKLPSDFKGMTPISYHKGDGSNLPVTLGPAIDQVSAIICKRGVRNSLVPVM